MPRVISGSARGRKLKSIPGDATRPILDRVKENLFNILGPAVVGTRWYDMFAGTGQIGIEALSRGAEFCLFTELDKRALRCIQENLDLTHLGEAAQVMRTDALAYLRGNPAIDPGFEYVFVAPPQYKDLWLDSLHVLDEHLDWIAPDGWVIVQIDPREFRDNQPDLSNLTLQDQREYGNTLLCFYQRNP